MGAKKKSIFSKVLKKRNCSCNVSIVENSTEKQNKDEDSKINPAIVKNKA